jgi:hypothetical protein
LVGGKVEIARDLSEGKGEATGEREGTVKTEKW